MFWWQKVCKLKCAKTCKNSCPTSHVLSFSLRDLQIWLLLKTIEFKLLFFEPIFFILTIIGARCPKIDNETLLKIIHSLLRADCSTTAPIVSRHCFGLRHLLNMSEICKNLLILLDRISGTCKGYVLSRLGREMTILSLWKKIEKKDSGWNPFVAVYFLRESLTHPWNHLRRQIHVTKRMCNQKNLFLNTCRWHYLNISKKKLHSISYILEVLLMYVSNNTV